jgi:hypothetical protein
MKKKAAITVFTAAFFMFQRNFRASSHLIGWDKKTLTPKKEKIVALICRIFCSLKKKEKKKNRIKPK